MGNIFCGESSDPKERKKSKDIDAQLQQDFLDGKKETKLLLLGPGESGKSTIVKQLKIIYSTGFAEEERLGFKPIIHSNIIISMGTLMRALMKDEAIGRLSKENQEYSQLMTSGETITLSELTPEVAAAVKSLWKEALVKDRFENKSDIHIIDSASYYFDELDRIIAPGYIPTEQDLLYSRVRTTGINEICFQIAKLPFRLVDVGGQRSERRKWIHCFQEVTAIFFIVAMSEYDQFLREEESTNRMEESLNLFEEICNCSWFVKTPMILFLNKNDLFQQKIQKVDMKVCFPEYTGGKDVKAGTQFLRDKFSGLNRNKEKKIYTHITCATNTENVKFVFMSVQDIFMNKNFENFGF